MDWEKIARAKERLSKEQGAVVKDWGGKIPFALIYPSSYFVGMSNLGVHAIYRWLNRRDDALCERVFWEKDDSVKSPTVSLESQRPLSDFTVLAFSVTFELDYFNVVNALKSSGLPLYSVDRNETHPLVIAGGPCMTANPLPLAPFFDCLCIGEAEVILPAMLPVIKAGVGEDRQALLKALATVPGVYVPRCHTGERVVRQCADDLDAFPVGSAVLTPDTELGNLYLIEVERGCNWDCRFCLAGQIFRPVRARSVDSILAQAREGLKYRQRFGLVGAAVSDHPQSEELVAGLMELGAGISVSSLRIKPLSEQVLRAVTQGTDTLALAPEAGSERLRCVIKKSITEADILEAMKKVAKLKIRELKLYFIIGLPTEADADIQEMAGLVLKCHDILGNGNGCRLLLTVAPFVPKTHTAFQWLPMERLDVIERRLSLLKSLLAARHIQVKTDSPAWSEVQAVLSRGDSRLAPVLAEMDKVSLAAWQKALKKHDLIADDFARRHWRSGEALPWSFLTSDVELAHQRKESDSAMADYPALSIPRA